MLLLAGDSGSSSGGILLRMSALNMTSPQKSDQRERVEQEPPR